MKKHLPWVFWGDAFTTAAGLLLILLFVHPPKLNRNKSGAGSAETEALKALTNDEKHVDGSVIRVLMARPMLLVFSLLYFGYSFSYAQWGFLLPMQTALDFGMKGAAFYGLLAGFNGLLVILLTPLITRYTRNLPYLSGMVIGGLLYAFSQTAYMFATGRPAYLLLMVIFTTAEVFVTLNAGTFVSVHTPASHRGRLTAVTSSISGVGYAVGPLVMGQVAGRFEVHTSWLFVGGTVLVASLSMLWLARWEKRNPT